MFKNLKFYETDGTNNTGSKETTVKEEDKTSDTEKVGPKESDEFKQIEKNLEDARNVILKEEGDIIPDVKPKEDDDPTKKEGGIKSEETTTDKIVVEPELNTAGLIEVTDDYITKESVKNFPEINKENLTEILNGIKGEQMSPKAFKNYIHSQNKIRYGEEEKPAEPSIKDDETVLPDPEKFELNLDAEQKTEVDEARIDLVYDDMKGKYPDLTKEILANRDKLNEFVSDLSINKPLDFADFVNDLKSANTQVDGEIKDYVYKAQNWSDIARVEMKKQVKVFVDFLAENGVKPEDIKADVSEAWIVKNLMRLENKDLNPKVMAYYKGDERIPVILPNSITNILKDRYLPEMLKIAKSDGIKHRIDTEETPSMSSASVKGKKTDIDDAVTGKTKIPEGTTDRKMMDKILEANRKAILEESED